MEADDLLRKSSRAIGQEDDQHGLGGEWEPNHSAWDHGYEQEPGADQDLRRSEQTAAINELLLESGLEKQNIDALLQGEIYTDQVSPETETSATEIASPSLSKGLVVIDQSAKNWRELAVSAPTDVEVLVLQQNQDGIDQIRDHLLQQRVEKGKPFSSLTIVCQGRDGQLQLGDRELRTSEPDDYANQLNSWRESLERDAAISIFDGSIHSINETDEAQNAPTGIVATETHDGNETNPILGNIAWMGSRAPTQGSVSELTANSSVNSPPIEHFKTVGEDHLVSMETYAIWKEALHQTNNILTELPQRDDFNKLIQDSFSKAGTEEDKFEDNLISTKASLGILGLGITVELITEDVLNGAKGAYTAVDPLTKTERIYLNANWINQGVSSRAISQVLLEEVGHSLDRSLNGTRDSRGDEGAIFAQKIFKGNTLDHAKDEDDRATLTINGKDIEVELSDDDEDEYNSYLTTTDVSFLEADNASTQNLTSSGTFTVNEFEDDYTINLQYALSTPPEWSGGPISDDLETALASGFHATVASYNDEDESTEIDWNYNVSNVDIDFLAVGETITLAYTILISEGEENYEEDEDDGDSDYDEDDGDSDRR